MTDVMHAVKLVSEEFPDEEGHRYRWECRCGQVGAIWWSQVEVAQRAGDEHLIEISRRSTV